MIETQEDAYDVTDELIDRYGDVPRSVEGLVEVAKLRRQAQDMHIVEIIQSGDSIIFYPEEINEKAMRRISAVGELFGKGMMLNVTGKPNFKINAVEKNGGPLALMKNVLDAMSAATNEAKKEA